MSQPGSSAWRQFIMTLGPGILFAGAAIGGSHLVQSTRAGALYGWELIWAIALVNLFKYPFFEFALRYTAATNESFLMGYRRLGRGWLVAFLVVALASGVLNIAALTVLSAGLAANLAGSLSLAGFTLSITHWAFIIVIGSIAMLLLGHYALFDKFVKVLVISLSVSTIIAVVVAAANGGNPPPAERPPLWDAVGITFLLGLMGWMPAPIDIAVFQSLWAMERRKETGYIPTLKQQLLDYNIGYIGTAIIALFFLALGALVMHGSGETFSESGIAFAAQLTNMYTQTLGGWTWFIVAVAGFSCIFSSVITCFDGYTRAVHESVQVLRDLPESRAAREDWFYWLVMLFFGVCTLVIAAFLLRSMIGLLMTATVIAFLGAPFMAALNLAVIRSDFVPKEFRAPAWLMALAWTGLAFLAGFALLWAWIQFGAVFGTE